MEKDDYIEFCTSLFDNLYRRRRGDLVVIQILSNLYATSGDKKNSMRMDRRHVRLDPLNPIAHYNLACDFAMRKSVDNAIQSLKTAINLGYNDVQWICDDVDLDPIRGDIRFKKLMGRYFVKTSSK